MSSLLLIISFRSTIACTLQQGLILSSCHGLPPKLLLSAINQMAKEGARAGNKEKNPEAKNRNTLQIPR